MTEGAQKKESDMNEEAFDINITSHTSPAETIIRNLLGEFKAQTKRKLDEVLAFGIVWHHTAAVHSINNKTALILKALGSSCNIVVIRV